MILLVGHALSSERLGVRKHTLAGYLWMAHVSS